MFGGLCQQCRADKQSAQFPICPYCGNEMTMAAAEVGRCYTCQRKETPELRRTRDAETTQEKQSSTSNKIAADIAASSLPLTTEMVPPFLVAERLGIVTGDCVLGMNLLKDLPVVLRDIVGGRSKTFQNALKEARETALQDMRREAHALGADAVVAVQISHQQISAGSAMLMVVATGTAVKRGEA
ncbi:MAG: hypothetical protein A2X69_16740 [Rhodobacteraceae bacterium GWF1_65_7]|nr:MAG: hypothetical protein A2X69_16740 [Rhodobacteraceae bacterium GWF1_65_7]